jgi:hypothetical protein
LGLQQDKPQWIYVVQLSIPAEHDDVFNELYDSDHIPAIMTVPGVKWCRRYKMAWSDSEEMPTYLAYYAVDNPDVPRSDAWIAAAGSGEWPGRIRPHLTARMHGMFQLLDSETASGADTLSASAT